MSQLSLQLKYFFRNRIAEGRKLLRSKSESEDLMIPDKPVTITTEVFIDRFKAQRNTTIKRI